MTPNDFINHQSLCSLPWNGIFVNPDGAIKNCAISRETLGNIHDTELPVILNNDCNKQIRKDMLNNVRHSRCKACYSVEDQSNDSVDNASNRSWYKKITLAKKTNLELFDSIDNFQPLILDLRWRNTCNQACVYCGPDLSSLWADNLNQPYRINNDVLNRSMAWILDNLDRVKHVYLAGGEPLLMKENQLLLEKLLVVSPDIEIRINSNLSNINNPIFRLLSKFSNVKWTVSVDSKEEFFEYMRWPGDWKMFLSNLDAVRNIVGDQINFNMVWCILNDLDLLDTIDYLMDQGYHENMFVVQCLTTPSALSILHLPKQHREDLQKIILKKQKESNPDWWLYKSLTYMYNFLNQEFVSNRPPVFHDETPLSQGLAGTFEFLDRINQLQKSDSSKIFTRLYQYK